MAHKDRAGLLYAASQLADPYGLSSPSLDRLDQTLTFAQAIAMSGFVLLPPDGIIRMTHTNPPRTAKLSPGQTLRNNPAGYVGPSSSAAARPAQF